MPIVSRQNLIEMVGRACSHACYMHTSSPYVTAYTEDILSRRCADCVGSCEEGHRHGGRLIVGTCWVAAQGACTMQQF